MQAITANRLSDGFVIYLTAEGRWSENIVDCAFAADAAECARLEALADRHVSTGQVINAYAFPVEIAGGTVRALGARESIRTSGPSVRPDLGYQAARR